MESMEHILISCQATPQRLIWHLAKDLWPHNQNQWPEIYLGIILRCESISLPKNGPWEIPNKWGIRDQRPKKWEAECLLQILISEAAHLIWALQCNRVIGNPDQIHTDEEIRSWWLKAINGWLTEDKIFATKIQHGKWNSKLVKETWEPTLWQSMDIPNDWIHNREVLVGRRAHHLP